MLALLCVSFHLPFSKYYPIISRFFTFFVRPYSCVSAIRAEEKKCIFENVVWLLSFDFSHTTDHVVVLSHQTPKIGFCSVFRNRRRRIFIILMIVIPNESLFVCESSSYLKKNIWLGIGLVS